MRRQRYQSGSLKKSRGKWVGQWWDGGHRRNRVLGPVSSTSKSDARRMLDSILAGVRKTVSIAGISCLKDFVESVYFPFYRRKWKLSTAVNNVSRVNAHVLAELGHCAIREFSRDDLQNFLDSKATTLSYSMVDHLRWDLKQIFEMAVAEGVIPRNQAQMLFTPRKARRSERLTMTVEEVRQCFSVLDMRERLIVQLAVVAGMRPGEILALTWHHVGADYAKIRQRVYRGVIDSPKTHQSVRNAALSDRLLDVLSHWRSLCRDTAADAWVFPSERNTPLSRDNVLRRLITPRLASVGLGWVNFQVMRRTHSTLMKNMRVDGKLVADQLGHSLDVNQNIYTQTPVAQRKPVIEQLEQALVN